MKYYIPTSSLNLDNILQAECISPLSFYAKRKTGYKSIELIDEVKQYNHVVLFDYPVCFSIEDSKRYNYPLLIEIEDDPQLQDINNINKKGMYLCGHTIYLTPLNCIFYFFSEDAYNLTTVNTKNNKSIKYYEQYRIHPSVLPLKLKPMKMGKISGTIGVCESNETLIDKQKGILYAFLAGQRMSVTPSLAHQLMLSQELYDILTSLISIPKMKDKLFNNLMHLLMEFKSVDQIELRNRTFFEQKINDDLSSLKIEKSSFKELLIKWGIKDSIYQHLAKMWGCEFLMNGMALETKEDFIRLRTNIEYRTQSALKEFQNNQPAPSFDAISISKDIVLIEGMSILNRAINFIINNQLTPELLSAERTNICKVLVGEVVEEIKKMKGEGYWDKSPEKAYVNRLYRHILDVGESFNVNEIDNPELVAVAAFLLRGQSFSDITTFLKKNEIHNYCYALTLWGALCGYMEMNKKALSNVLTISNYKNIYECLLNKSIGELACPEALPIDESDKQGYLAILKIMKISDKILDELDKALDSCQSIDIEVCINNTLNSKMCKNSPKMCKLARTAYQLVMELNNENAFRATLKDLSKSEKTRKDISAYFRIPYAESKQDESIEMDVNKSKELKVKKYISKSAIKNAEPYLFDNQDIIGRKDNTRIFNYQNLDHILIVITTCFPYLNEKIIDILKKDLKWVLDPKYSEHLSGKDLLEKFQAQLSEGKSLPISLKGKDMQWKNETYKDLDIDAIIKCLSERFDN